MEEHHFSKIKMSMFQFFETKIKKSALFKANEKVVKKQQELKKATEKDKLKKQQELEALLITQQQQRQASLTTEIPDYLTECANKAISVNKPMFKVTHPVKFTHGLAPYGGIYVQNKKPAIGGYLTSENLQTDNFDITNSNGNLITHARFLMLNLDGKTIYDRLKNEDDTWMLEFTHQPKQAEQWSQGLKHWIAETAQIEDAAYLKQSYFPIDTGYHLLSPLFSSSFCQAIYERIRWSIFNQDNIKRRKAKKAKLYAKETLIEYPNIAVMKYGGTQPQNISAGNFERHGEAFLLPCSPPHWQSSLKPPCHYKSIFSGEFERRAWKTVKTLQRYLAQLGQRKGNKEIRNHVRNWVEQLIDILFIFVAEIQNLKDQAGWSETDCKLKSSHQLWLDCHRQDEAFQQERASNAWQKEVCDDFGIWLNRKLKTKDKMFAQIEATHWAKLLQKSLREFERDLEKIA